MRHGDARLAVHRAWWATVTGLSTTKVLAAIGRLDDGHPGARDVDDSRLGVAVGSQGAVPKWRERSTGYLAGPPPRRAERYPSAFGNVRLCRA